MEKKSQEFSIQEAKRLAESSMGRQLASLLQQADQTALQDALSSANAGDYDDATKKIKELLASPQGRALLKQLGK